MTGPDREVGPYLPNLNTSSMQRLQPFLVSHVKFPRSHSLIQMVLLYPLFIVTIPGSSRDGSHLEVLTARHVLLAPAAVGGGGLRFPGAGPDFPWR